MTFEEDEIRRLLEERSYDVENLSWRQDSGRKQRSLVIGFILKYIIGAIAAAHILIVIACMWALSDADHPDWIIYFPDYITTAAEEREYLEHARTFGIVVAVITLPLFAVGNFMVLNARVSLAEQEQERRDDRALRARFQEMDLSQRVAIVASMSNIAVERIRSAGIVTTEELRYLREEAKAADERREAQRNRDHEAREASRNRSHEQSILESRQKHESVEAVRNRIQEQRLTKTQQRHEITKLIKRFAHEMEMWKEKIKVDYKNEPEKIRERMAAWDMVDSARQSINDTDDPDEQLRRLRAFEKFLYSTMQ